MAARTGVKVGAIFAPINPEIGANLSTPGANLARYRCKFCTKWVRNLRTTSERPVRDQSFKTRPKFCESERSSSRQRLENSIQETTNIGAHGIENKNHLVNPIDTTQRCSATDGEGITCASHQDHQAHHWCSVWDFSGIGIYRQEWSDYPQRSPGRLGQPSAGFQRDAPDIQA